MNLLGVKGLMQLGSIYPGVPRELTYFLRERFEIADFIETGTNLGVTANWASCFFDRVYTIELSEELYLRAKKRYGKVQNLSFFQGKSVDVLRILLSNLHSPAIFWLDAHWSMGKTAGENIDCPLIEEVQIIINANENHFLLIDDARNLLFYPPETLSQKHLMPSIEHVFELLHSEGKRYSVIWRDVLISVPQIAEDVVYGYLCTQGHPIFSNYKEDFAVGGVGCIARAWQKSIAGLTFLPGAIRRSLSARMNRQKPRP